MSSEHINILALSGSLRQGSLNSASLHAAVELAPEGAHVTLGSIAGIPPYDEDVRSAGTSEPVMALAEAIAAAHTLVDDAGNLADETTRMHIRKLLDALVSHTRLLAPARGRG